MPHQPRRLPPSALLPLLLAAAALAAANAQAAASSNAQAAAEESAPRPRPSVAIVAPDRLRQGDLLLAWIVEAGAPTDLSASSESASPSLPAVRLLGPDGAVAAEARPFELPAVLEPAGPQGRSERVYGALIPLPMRLPPGAYSIAAAAADGAEAGASLAVAAREFPMEVIGLDEANTAIRACPSRRKEAEAKKLGELLAWTDGAAVYADPGAFIFPVEGGFKSAGFGDRRRYLLSSGGSETSEHAGLDWGVVKGTSVRACARGKVVMAARREVTGVTVVLEHLPGLYSLYFHLSAAKVKEGQFVERGQAIALSGSTGMSTGPHLHWELRALGQCVDPEPWLAAPLLDKDAIKATIYGLIEGR